MTITARILLLASALCLALALAAAPAAATEAGEGEETPAEATEGATETETEGGGAGDEEESSRISFPSNPHNQVGFLVWIFLGIGTAAALYNARKQLRGDRSQATGEFRWR